MKELGVEINEFDDGFSIVGPQNIKSGSVITNGDHRIAMAFSIAKLVSKGSIMIDNPECASVSFPEFYELLASIQKYA